MAAAVVHPRLISMRHSLSSSAICSWLRRGASTLTPAETVHTCLSSTGGAKQTWIRCQSVPGYCQVHATTLLIGSPFVFLLDRPELVQLAQFKCHWPDPNSVH